MSAHIYLAAIVARDGRLLLHRRSPTGPWELPGGPLLPEHEDVDAAMQVILAAMGIHTGPMEQAFLETIYLRRDEGGYLVYNLYDAAGWTGQPTTPADIEARWFAPEDVERIDMDDQVRASLLAALGLRDPVDTTEAILAAMSRSMGASMGPGSPPAAGLDVRARALLDVAVLAALGRERGLAWYMELALDCGVSPSELTQAVQLAAERAGEDVTAGARATLADVLALRGLTIKEGTP